ncbi:MAG: hypothetical protein Q8K60_02530 [Parachlamydiaceae bacterium]|nr:hypothetical protein [Parachlamydiaceae bacterium]
MIKLTCGLLTVLSLLNFSFSEAVSNAKSENQSPAEEKYKVINIDQRDSTDIYAIPYDDSEIEDEEEINRAEKKKVFPIPNSR